MILAYANKNKLWSVTQTLENADLTALGWIFLAEEDCINLLNLSSYFIMFILG